MREKARQLILSKSIANVAIDNAIDIVAAQMAVLGMIIEPGRVEVVKKSITIKTVIDLVVGGDKCLGSAVFGTCSIELSDRASGGTLAHELCHLLDDSDWCYGDPELCPIPAWIDKYKTHPREIRARKIGNLEKGQLSPKI